MRNFLTRAIALILLATTYTQAGISVLHPRELKRQIGNDGVIRSSLANFGHIVYGTSVMGRVYYPKSNRDACQPFNAEVDFPKEFLMDEKSDVLPIVLVDRGNCTFVNKVRNIEKLGVKLAVISDDKSEDTENLVMSDDGTGNTVNIPSFIIRKAQADIIKRFISESSTSAYLKATLDIVHPDNRVEYDFWYSTVIDAESWLIYDLSLYQQALGANALFTPRILTYSCRGCSPLIKKQLCLADGAYCPYFPNQKIPDRLAGIEEGLFLYETLRQRCAYEVVSKEPGNTGTLRKWFDFATDFLDYCMENNMTFGDDCANTYLKKAGIDTEKVDRCLRESFITDDNGKIIDNRLLKEDREWTDNQGIFIHPSVSVNNITYRGDLNGYDIFKAVCAGFSEQPDVCKGDAVFDVITRLQEGSSNRHSSSRFAKGYHIVGAIIIVMMFNCLALYLYRRYNRQKMNEQLQLQVNSAVSQYFKLSGQDQS